MTIKRQVIKVTKLNEVFIRIDTDKGILKELYEHFGFFAKNYKFNPLFKNTNWDGKIRLFNLTNQTIYTGLIHEVIGFANKNNYDLDVNYSDFAETELSKNEAIDFIKRIIKEVKIPDFEQEIREYQLESFIKMIRSNRLLLLSPTSSGKSFMIYLLHRWYNLKTLIVTDSTSAVHQMARDFVTYGYDENKIHKIYSGQEKDKQSNVVVSTFQSMASLSDEYLNQFNVVVIDECWHAHAKSFRNFMERITTAKYRFGVSGTLDKDIKIDEMMLIGLFGKLTRLTTTAELIDQGYVSDIKIKNIILQYGNETKDEFYLKSSNLKSKELYNFEINFLENNSKRNNFIKNLACSLDGNTLLFFRHKEHGEKLFELIKKEIEKQGKGKALLAHGGVEGEKRLEIASEIENTESGIVAIVSYGTFQAALSIKNVHNLIFGLPTKSINRVLQSIGRGLRLHKTKKFVNLHDIADNLITKDNRNITIRHFTKRLKIYNNEKFKVKIYNIKLEK